MKSTVAAMTIMVAMGIAAAVPARVKRQAVMGCISAFQNVPNQCATNPTGQVFFAHPFDPTKFVQCDINQRMYIVQCPSGEVFNAATTACEPSKIASLTLPQSQTTQASFIPTTLKHNSPGPARTQGVPTLPPQSTPRVLGQHTPNLSQTATTTPKVPSIITPAYNPCTPSNLALGKRFFAFPGDKSRFYQCDAQGNPKVVACPPTLQWDQLVQSCMFPRIQQQQTGGQGQSTPQTNVPQTPAGQSNNPCTAKALSAGRFFFPHPSDPQKYIQCDMWGDAFTNTCPQNLVWNAYLETCYSAQLTGRK